MIVAGGMKFVLLSALLYAPGTVLYFWARREQGKQIFNTAVDWVIFAAAVIGCIVAIVALATGYLTI
jgi:arginine:ornithine antiporter/lysine permease